MNFPGREIGGMRRCARSKGLKAAVFVLALTSIMAISGEQPKEDAGSTQKSSSEVSALIGHVNARSGEAISGATVSLKDIGNRRHEKAISTVEGAFRFAGLPAGEYRLEIAARG